MNPQFEANLRALNSRPELPFRLLAAALAKRGPEPEASARSRSGEPWPSVSQGGRRVAIVSTFDADAEARRWAEGLTSGSSLVVWGASGPWAWQAALESGAPVVFAIEPRIEVWQSLLSWSDCTPLIDSPRWFALWGEPEECARWISGRYHPLWDGGLASRDWRSTTADQDLWTPFRKALSSALGRWIGDFSTQARFGARWYRNTWFNLRGLEAPALNLKPSRGAIITGAGPGLETALELADSRALLEGRPENGWIVLATDTSLPALLSRGLIPDVVLCLDGQLPSAHHFHGRLPAGLPLLADITSLPLLHRLGMTVFPFLSGHPLGKVISRCYSGLPELDGSTGNVSGLGLALARYLGAPEIRLWGADFSYPDGKPYARGTYVYPLHDQRSGRLRPTETRITASCYGAAGLERLGTGSRFRYTTPLLKEYRSRMFAHASTQPGRISVPEIEGWTPVAVSKIPPRPPAVWQRVTGDFDALREDWRTRLENLPRPRRGETVPSMLSRLAVDRREDWLALWPLGLALQRIEGGGEDFIDRLVARALEPLQD